MDKYGWYLGGEDQVRGTGNDVAELIQHAVNEFTAAEEIVAEERGDSEQQLLESIGTFIGKMRVGEMEQLSASQPLECQEGRNPIPMCLVDGAWIWGDKQHENADVSAYVVYTTEPSPETGHIGWAWWALGRMGDANTLQDAMAQAKAKLAQITAAEQANGR